MQLEKTSLYTDISKVIIPDQTIYYSKENNNIFPFIDSSSSLSWSSALRSLKKAGTAGSSLLLLPVP